MEKTTELEKLVPILNRMGLTHEASLVEGASNRIKEQSVSITKILFNQQAIEMEIAEIEKLVNEIKNGKS